MSHRYTPALMRTVVGTLTCAIAIGAKASVILVLDSGDASVSVIDPAGLGEIRRFEVGKEPHHLMATPDGQTLIVANAAGDDLVFFDPAWRSPHGISLAKSAAWR